MMLAVAQAGSRLVAVGERGIVLLSDDQGRQWRQAITPVSTTLTGVHFPTASDGWVVGHSGVVLHSADGGQTWIKQLDGVQAASATLSALQAIDPGDSRFNSAAIKGAELLVADGPDKPLLDVHFWNTYRGIVVGAYGLALETDDGGRTWRSLGPRIPNPQGRHLYRVVTRGIQTWLIGEQGAIFRSRDGNDAYAEVPIPYEGTLFGMIAIGDDDWLVYGLRGNAFRTSDAGRAWVKVPNEQPETLTNAARLADGRLVMVDQAGRFLVSLDERSMQFASQPTASIPPINAVVQTSDGSIVFSTVRGMVRVDPVSKH
ncbi:MAG: YCF48-related protein [Burkholderiaceae bacterium]|nr:YCF48-related protein [Burkholderiaceae bacterium]